MSRSIKFRNDTFLRAESVVYGRTAISDYLYRGLYHWNTYYHHLRDFNKLVKNGLYFIQSLQSDSPYANGPFNYSYFGVLMVINSRPYDWVSTDMSNWTFQLLFTTRWIYIISIWC